MPLTSDHLSIKKVLAVSRFLEKTWLAAPAILDNLLDDPVTLNDVDENYFFAQMALWDIPDENTLEHKLRVFRQQQMSRFIYRFINRLCSTEQLIRELSWFADACIQKAVDWNYADLVKAYGTPLAESNRSSQPFVVLGMGKLGAYELNLSSDIDLIFCYPEAGETDGTRPIDNQQFFIKLGQRIIKNLDKMTIDGFVFRVDMRLRPYGQSSALALNFDAMELYYESQGREWERYAMIKARCVAGDKQAGAELLRRLKPFIYRKYTDFSAVQALRDMKELINREVRRLGKQDDVKLGSGGIREIEFIAQSYQLIYGGRDEALQERSVLTILYHLGERGLLSVDDARQLHNSYIFLRDVEHGIQAIDDEQTQRLPVDAEKQSRLILALGYASWEEFLADLYKHRQFVRTIFAELVTDTDCQDSLSETGNQQKKSREHWRDIWLDSDPLGMELRLKEFGFSSSEVQKLNAFKRLSKVEHLSPIALERLNSFMPALLQAMQAIPDRGDAMTGLLALVEAVLRRTAYLVLFNENPKAIERLIVIAKASDWIMQQLVAHPVLLDELITTEGLGRVPESNELRELLTQQSLRLNVDDIEAHMDMLRYFRLAHHLHIVAAEASGKLPLMKVSDYLSFLADAVLNYVLQISWLQMVEKHGFPTLHGEPCNNPPFAIIAYGKLGGLELSHSSDLDLVFLYEADDDGVTDGEKSVDNRVFFTRMGQKIIHILTTQTMLGRLYEVDMRLRPSGGKGLLVGTLDAFEKYQQEQAWTWEHQALVRARPVAGSQPLIDKFQQIRLATLNRQRDIPALRKEVNDMRVKMYEHLAPAYTKSANAELFDLKHSRGGIVDIEFMVQYAVLAWGYNDASIARYTDNIRILEALAKTGFLSPEDAQTLTDAYRSYRAAGHKLALLEAKAEVPVQQFAPYIAEVKRLWKVIFNQ